MPKCPATISNGKCFENFSICLYCNVSALILMFEDIIFTANYLFHLLVLILSEKNIILHHLYFPYADGIFINV